MSRFRVDPDGMPANKLIAPPLRTSFTDSSAAFTSATDTITLSAPSPPVARITVAATSSFRALMTTSATLAAIAMRSGIMPLKRTGFAPRTRPISRCQANTGKSVQAAGDRFGKTTCIQVESFRQRDHCFGSQAFRHAHKLAEPTGIEQLLEKIRTETIPAFLALRTRSAGNIRRNRDTGPRLPGTGLLRFHHDSADLVSQPRSGANLRMTAQKSLHVRCTNAAGLHRHQNFPVGDFRHRHVLNLNRTRAVILKRFHANLESFLARTPTAASVRTEMETRSDRLSRCTGFPSTHSVASPSIPSTTMLVSAERLTYRDTTGGALNKSDAV